jgi:hypothetical protein
LAAQKAEQLAKSESELKAAQEASEKAAKAVEAAEKER